MEIKQVSKFHSQQRHRKWDCLGFGLCAADYLCIVPHYPRLDEKIDAVEFSQQGGGPVATAMATLGRLGAKPAFLGKVGGDLAGQFIQQELEKDGVDTSLLIVAPTAYSAQAFLWIDRATGKRTCVLSNNQIPEVKPEEINPEWISQTGFLHIDGRDEEAALFAARTAKEKGVPVVMDVGSVRRRMEEFFPVVDYFVCSQSFVQQFLSNCSPEKAVATIKARGPKVAIITLGEQGSIAFDGKNIYLEPAFKVKVVDTTGAGDVYHGAFIYGLLQEWPLPLVLCFANAVAALKCTALGGRKGIPTLTKAVDFLQQSRQNMDEQFRQLLQAVVTREEIQ